MTATASPSIFDKLKSAKRLPSPPGTALRVLELCRSNNSDLREISDVIMADPALSGRLLKFANSSIVGVSKSVTSVRDAVLLLGLKTVKLTALGFSLAMGIEAKCPGFDLKRYWTESFLTAVIARRCAQLSRADREEAFTAALLAAIGRLALAHALPDEYGKVPQDSPAGRRALVEQERVVLGTDHVEIGALLLEDWKLPEKLVEPIRYQFQPLRVADELRGIALTIDLATTLAPLFLGAESLPDEVRQAARKAIEEKLEQDEAQWQATADEVLADFQQITDTFEVDLEPAESFDLYAEAQEEATRVGIVAQLEKTRAMQENKDLRRRATTDALTGIANRGRLDERLSELLSNPKPNFALLMFDIDHFKKFNDTYGHDVGDLVLKRVAQQVQGILRETDLLARYGGEEFVIIAPQVDRRSACAIAARVRNTVEKLLVESGGNALHVTISVGLAMTMDYRIPPTAEEIVTCADKQLYRSKKAGRNTWSYLDRTASEFAPNRSAGSRAAAE